MGASVSSAFGLYAARCRFTDGTDLLFDDLSSLRIDGGLQTLLMAGSGQYRNRLVNIRQQDPIAEFMTPKMTALGTIGMSGKKIDSDIDDEGLELSFEQLDEGGTRKASTDDLLVTVNEGALVPTSLNAGSNDPASLTYVATCSWDGTNDPLVIASGQNVSESLLAPSVWYAGPCAFNGTTVNGVQSINMQFGFVVKALRGSGQVWPTLVYLKKVQPKVVINSLDVAHWATLGLTGAAQTATNSQIYLVKGAPGQARVADATEEHIEFLQDDGAIYVSDGEATDEGEATINIVFEPVWDGTNEIFVIDTTAAIPL